MRSSTPVRWTRADFSKFYMIEVSKIWFYYHLWISKSYEFLRSTKFWGRSSKIKPAMSISILKFKQVWQVQFFSHTLQILVIDRFFIGNQMIFYSIFCISNRKAEIWEKLLFLFLSSPQVVKSPMIMDYNYHLGATQERKK